MSGSVTAETAAAADLGDIFQSVQFVTVVSFLLLPNQSQTLGKTGEEEEEDDEEEKI